MAILTCFSLRQSLIFVFNEIFYNYFAQAAAGRDSVAFWKAAEQRHICSQKVTKEQLKLRSSEISLLEFHEFKALKKIETSLLNL